MEDGVTCISHTPSYYSNENNEKECYTRCPSDKYIYEEEKKCVNRCPDGYYHEKNSKTCIKPDECATHIADYDTQECVTDCGNKYISNYVDPDDSTKTAEICLSSCNNRYGMYLTPDFKCVTVCEDYTLISHLISDSTTKQCRCDNYYYIGDDSIMVCMDSDKECKDNTNDYKILKYGTKQCLKICDKIKSVNGDICYKNSVNACRHSNDANSLVINNQCVCKNKWYKDTSNNNKKICLAENAECQYSFYIPDTKECVQDCPALLYPKKYYNYCLNKCPKGSTEDSSNVCSCINKFWYEVSNGNYECLEGDCLDSYPLYVSETKQCLETCKGSYFPNLFGNKCYRSCNTVESTVALNTKSVGLISNYSNYVCKCEDPWYYEGKIMTCPNDADHITDCSQYTGKDFKFMIKETKECVKECPPDYPYYFNKMCFKSCENEAKSLYNLNVKTVELSYECQCVNLWYYEDAAKTIKKCLDETITECIEYNSDNGVNYEYQVFKTKECVPDETKCPTNSYKFNYKCYEKCPEFTVDLNDESHQCQCNTEEGYWYESEKHNRKYLTCGLEECPNINIGSGQYSRSNLLEKLNKCVISCSEDTDTVYPTKYAFRNICVNDCPEKTNKEVDKCTFYNLNDETNINDLEKTFTDVLESSLANIRTK